MDFQHSYKSLGFTLMELLIVMGILAILAALAVPVSGKISETRANMTCVSNLRQIGMGIQLYAMDNRDTLPGPLMTGVFPYWPSQRQLAYHLKDILELEPRIRKQVKGKDVFLCPGYRNAVSAIGDAPVYTLNVEVLFDGESRPLPPFGYPNSIHPVIFKTNKDFAPMRLAQLPNIVDANGNAATGTTWMIKDADARDPRFAAYQSDWTHELPKTPVHGGHRNALFFDFHIGKDFPEENNL